jgi:hypothetical protein
VHHSFVSYSRSDAAWVQQLVARLERHGVRIWIDRRDIPVTVPWMDEVRDAITEADLFLCCDSPAFQSSDNCRAETDLAAQAGKPQLKVAVAGDVAEAESNVLQSWRHIAPERFQRTELGPGRPSARRASELAGQTAADAGVAGRDPGHRDRADIPAAKPVPFAAAHGRRRDRGSRADGRRYGVRDVQPGADHHQQ